MSFLGFRELVADGIGGDVHQHEQRDVQVLAKNHADLQDQDGLEHQLCPYGSTGSQVDNSATGYT